MLNLPIFLFEVTALFFLSRSLTRSLSKIVSIQFFSFLFLPGIVIHELSHMLVAAVLFVPVGDIEFTPKVTEAGISLGSTAIGKTDPIRRALIGLAPILVGLLILFAMTNSYSQTLIFLYVVFEVSNTMFSSFKDLEGLLEVFIVFILLAAVFYVFTQITNLSFPEITLDLNKVGILLAPLIMVLTIAVVIDIVAIVFLKVIRKVKRQT